MWETVIELILCKLQKKKKVWCNKVNKLISTLRSRKRVGLISKHAHCVIIRGADSNGIHMCRWPQLPLLPFWRWCALNFEIQSWSRWIKICLEGGLSRMHVYQSMYSAVSYLMMIMINDEHWSAVICFAYKPWASRSTHAQDWQGQRVHVRWLCGTPLIIE